MARFPYKRTMKTATNTAAVESISTTYTKGCYGAEAKPSEVRKWLLKHIQNNITRQDGGVPRITLNIWGAPGCGKTSIVKQLDGVEVTFDSKPQRIKVVDFPMGQVEEMGDIVGLPTEEVEVLKDTEKKWINPSNSSISECLNSGYTLTGNKRMSYAPPSWVPTEERPGVLLIDDGNRASQRIMRGAMQLVQDYKTIGWSLPRGWTIVFTGNPDNRFNQVSSMDSAQLTRMKHITYGLDAKEWGIWAEAAGLDPRGIAFVLKNERMMVGKDRTNPRTLSEFFYTLKEFKDLKDEETMRWFNIEASSSLDEETVAAMYAFLTRDCNILVEPLTILERPEEAAEMLSGLMDDKKATSDVRTDVVYLAMERLVNHLLMPNYTPTDSHVANFKKWVLNKLLPADLVYQALLRFSSTDRRRASPFINDQQVMHLVFDMYKKE